MIRLARGPFGSHIIENLDADGTVVGDILAQLDYDYPGIAADFGWSVRSTQHPSYPPDGPCDHSGTDGTVDCGECTLPASVFIADAADWLDAHIGATADDPGYFGAS